MNKQEYYRALYKQENPTWENSLELFKKSVASSIQQDAFVLDIGCGHSDLLQEIYSVTRNTYGIDPDAAALAQNTTVQNKSVGGSEALPYPDNFFDLVSSAWVLEHLEHPALTFQEIYRVLKPGGKFIFLTPNAANYNVHLIKIIPSKTHGPIAKFLYKRNEQDTYPKFYRANNLKKLTNQFTKAGFSSINLRFNGDPTYISFNQLTYKAAVLIEKTINRYFSKSKVHIIGECTK